MPRKNPHQLFLIKRSSRLRLNWPAYMVLKASFRRGFCCFHGNQTLLKRSWLRKLTGLIPIFRQMIRPNPLLRSCLLHKKTAGRLARSADCLMRGSDLLVFLFITIFYLGKFLLSKPLSPISDIRNVGIASHLHNQYISFCV